MPPQLLKSMERTSPQNLRILFTNTALANATGTEVYVRDLAREFTLRGDNAVIYAPRVGPLAQELHDLAIPVTNNPTALGVAPDIIHGQHHVPTLQAMTMYPQAPAVFFCHGWRPWEEMPPSFPRIRRYVAVDTATRDRIIHEGGVSPEKVSILPNFVDLTRFRPRWPLPPFPAKAVIFSNYVKLDSPFYKAVKQACMRLGVELDVIGSGFGTETHVPEIELQAYDLVFAQGRSAIESLAVGTAVIVASSRKFGSLVSSQNYDQMRQMNFGIRAQVHPVTSEHIEAEILKFNPQDAAEVTQRIHEDASLKNAATAIRQLYQEAIREHQEEPVSPKAEQLAMTSYLAKLDQRLQRTSQFESQVRRLETRLAELQEFSKERGRIIQRIQRSRHWRFRNWIMNFRNKFSRQ